MNRRLYKGHSLIKNLDNYTVLDIETTSLDSFNGEILEISAIKVREKKEVNTFSELIKTKNKIGYFTTNLTGITNKIVQKDGKDLILDNLIDYFNLVKRNEHRALNDFILTDQVYLRLANMLERSK